MSASPTAATVPAHRIGTACFRAIDGRMCGLHIKNTNVFALSVVQEPLSVFIGSFRFARLATATNTAATHLPSIAEAFIKAFDVGDVDAVKLLYSNNPQQDDDEAAAASQQQEGSSAVSRRESIAQGSSQLKALRRKSSLLLHHSTPQEYDRDNGPTNSEKAAPIPTLLVHFMCFGVEHSVTLTLQPCQGTNKDTFMWTVLMDMYRVVLRQNTATGSATAGGVVKDRGNTSPQRSPQREAVDGGTIGGDVRKDDGESATKIKGKKTASQRPSTAGSAHPHVGNSFRTRQPTIANGVEQHIRAAKASANALPKWKPTNQQKPHLLGRENPTDWAVGGTSVGGKLTDSPRTIPAPKYSQHPPGTQPVVPHKTVRSAGGGGWRPPPRGRTGAPPEGDWNLFLNGSREELQKQLLTSYQRVAELENALCVTVEQQQQQQRRSSSGKKQQPPSSAQHAGDPDGQPETATEKLIDVSHAGSAAVAGGGGGAKTVVHSSKSASATMKSRPLPQLYLSGEVLEAPMIPSQFHR